MQRSIGNAATLHYLSRTQSSAISVQRFIKVGDQSYAPGMLASQYADKNKQDKSAFARARNAYDFIDREGKPFESDIALETRFLEVMEEQKDRAIIPITREVSSRKVATELDYWWDAVNPKPSLEFKETYETSWDTTGGWGAEYWPITPEGVKWVVHVHRGPNGGLKSGSIKEFDERMLKETGRSVKLDTLTKLKIPQVDAKRTHI